MSLRQVQIPPEVTGTLWLSSMPGRFEPWPTFLQEARQARLDRVICLAPSIEVAELSPAYWRAVGDGDVPFRWSCLPMRNFGLPEDAPGFRHEMQGLAQALRAGESVLLHCAAGIGRTGSAAACVLKALGLSTDEALERVQAAGANPQNAMQSGFVHWF